MPALCVHLCAAMPVPKDVSENYPELRKFFSLPYEERITRDSTVEKFTESLINSKFGSSRGAQVQACTYLAWASDAASLAALEYFDVDAFRETPDWVGGAALYALKIREHRDRSKKEMFAILSYELSRSRNMSERMFIVNRLWCDYEVDALPVILETAKEINNIKEGSLEDIIKQDFLYYLSHAEDPSLIREILNLDWPESIEVSDEWLYVMESITPGRSMESDYLSFFSIKRLKEKLSQISK